MFCAVHFGIFAVSLASTKWMPVVLPFQVMTTTTTKKNGSKHYLCSPWVESGENSLWSRTTKLEETHIFTVTTKEILAMDWLEMELEK